MRHYPCTASTVLRNDVRVIAAGSGCADDIQLEPLPENTDIRVGDVLVTSGLGGRFPEGYPVGVVSAVNTTHNVLILLSARSRVPNCSGYATFCYYGEMIATLKRHYSLRKFIVQQMND